MLQTSEMPVLCKYVRGTVDLSRPLFFGVRNADPDVDNLGIGIFCHYNLPRPDFH